MIKRVCIQVDLRHMDEQAGSNVVSVGVDLSEFYMSVEWDILEVPAVRYVHLLYYISFTYGAKIMIERKNKREWACKLIRADQCKLTLTKLRMSSRKVVEAKDISQDYIASGRLLAYLMGKRREVYVCICIF